MSRSLVFWILMCGVLVVAATSRSDVATTTADAPDREPITDAPAVSAPGSETPVRDPFSPYDPGPQAWSYASLKPAERAVADRGRDVSGWGQTHDAFADASRELATRAASSSAASQLGIIDDLAATGVTP